MPLTKNLKKKKKRINKLKKKVQEIEALDREVENIMKSSKTRVLKSERSTKNLSISIYL
jgi:hypothetical protein